MKNYLSISKTLSLMLLCSLLFTFSSGSTFANEKNVDRYSIVTVDGTEAIRDSVKNIYIISPVKADGTKLSLQEYLVLLENSDQKERNHLQEKSIAPKAPKSNTLKSPTISPMYVWTTQTYAAYSPWTSYGPGSQISASLACPSAAQGGTTPCPITSSYSTTTSETWSVSASTTDIKSAVKLTAGFSWVTSSSSTTSYTIPVPIGRTAYMQFQQLINHTQGWVTTKWWNDGFLIGTDPVFHVYATSPAKLPNGYSNGIYSLFFTV